uniref:Reverse transcriptase domain-containing protein n=1 Tax=Chromera velia CCMP2878 TaxID=1169474 RepID=A0A0G4FMB1_9ALVE|eukprot:Cvel_17734.t1-p1 / transcript=Cvel_17734.t1 / gene=Cvel_17734 / organism=Chromera_velia_CCMP2878 / gene_product=hypothetical protein / transcript_product=hypothetical protein / location=Cvel_scaffold1433:420-1745(-) / protein_length=309 / sequence_SO=supercontig / SO=protein_coding / is_pseudo=false
MGRRVFEWDQVKALMACRLVALDKCPGVRPVGIGEAIRRLLRKAVMKETREELQEACGADQLCSGLMGGLEGGIHAVRELWETLTQEASDNPEKAFGTLLIDAKNAFNAANRTAGLWNAHILWPRASKFLFNCYRGDAELFLRGTHGITTISSREGWTQGDQMSMAGYAITIFPLVRALQGSGSEQMESETQLEASGNRGGLQSSLCGSMTVLPSLWTSSTRSGFRFMIRSQSSFISGRLLFVFGSGLLVMAVWSALRFGGNLEKDLLKYESSQHLERTSEGKTMKKLMVGNGSAISIGSGLEQQNQQQ